MFLKKMIFFIYWTLVVQTFVFCPIADRGRAGKAEPGEEGVQLQQHCGPSPASQPLPGWQTGCRLF